MVARGSPGQWHQEVDVVAVGSGFPGLAAAAGGLGAEVVMLEKTRRYTGNSPISGDGYCCWDSKLHLRQKLGLGDDTWQQHVEDTLKGGDYCSNPKLV
jgi:fumarate reductase flavoprotein subunit